MRAYQDTYKILSEIGHGGMGTVYLVKHETMGVLRAMKAVPKDADTSELPAEVEILTNLEHPCLVKIIDVFEDPCYVFQMTELSGNTVPIQGETVQSVAVLEDTKGFD